MDRWIRRVVERALFDKVVVANAASQPEILRLVRSLLPVAVPSGLVRIGPPGDGGYLVPDDFEGIAACLSPGVSNECGFDLAVAERGIPVIMADASVAGPPTAHPLFDFIPKFLDVVPGGRTLTIEEMVRPAPTGDLLLQMDIEGAEYRVLTSMSDDLLRRVRIAVVEFHELDQMFSRFGFSTIAAAFAKLTQHHSVVHIHPNNNSAPVRRGDVSVPPLMEFTFYRRDRFTPSKDPVSYPHPLDACCVPSRPAQALPECWQA